MRVRVRQDRTRIVTDCARDAVRDPSSKCVAVMKTGNCWWDKRLPGKFVTLVDPNLLQPRLVECDFLLCITVCNVVLRQMGERV